LNIVPICASSSETRAARRAGSVAPFVFAACGFFRNVTTDILLPRYHPVDHDAVLASGDLRRLLAGVVRRDSLRKTFRDHMRGGSPDRLVNYGIRNPRKITIFGCINGKNTP
jgi:hypothetical protein